jgi:hypothetical protein
MPGPADHRRAQVVAQAADGVEREVAEEAVEPVDVRVERLTPDAEVGGEAGEGQRVDARLVGQVASRGDDGVVVESHLRGHAPPARRLD